MSEATRTQCIYIYIEKGILFTYMPIATRLLTVSTSLRIPLEHVAVQPKSKKPILSPGSAPKTTNGATSTKTCSAYRRTRLGAEKKQNTLRCTSPPTNHPPGLKTYASPSDAQTNPSAVYLGDIGKAQQQEKTQDNMFEEEQIYAYDKYGYERVRGCLFICDTNLQGAAYEV